MLVAPLATVATPSAARAPLRITEGPYAYRVVKNDSEKRTGRSTGAAPMAC